MKTYVALDEINFPPILVYNAFGRETIVYRNIVQYFTSNQIWAFESAVEILTLFSVSPVDMLNVLGTLSCESWGRQAEEGRAGITDAGPEVWSAAERRLNGSESCCWTALFLLSWESCPSQPGGIPWGIWHFQKWYGSWGYSLVKWQFLDLRDLRWTNYYFSGIWLLEHFQNICVYKKVHTKMLKCPRRDSTIWDRVSWRLSPKSFCCEILGKGRAQWSD